MKFILFIMSFTICNVTNSSFLVENSREQKGTICFKIGSCDYMIVCLEDGEYAVIEDYDYSCEEDDVLVADFSAFGFQEIYNLTKESALKVYIEECVSVKEDAIEIWKDQCD